MANSTLTLQSVVNLALTHADLMPLVGVGGFSNEPALSLCIDALQELMSGPSPWKFNSAELNLLVTQPNRQTYQFAGATAWTVNSGVGIGLASNNAITESGNIVTVNTLDPHNLNVGETVYMNGNTVAAYNSLFTQTASSSAWTGGWVITSTPTATSFTFVHASSGLAASGAAGITDFGWLESGTMVQMSDTSSPQGVKYLRAVRTMQPSSFVSQPERASVIQDLGTGVIRVRLYPIAGSAPFGITLVYQKKTPLKTALTDTWAPFPDELSYVYRQAFLARAYRFIDSRRADAEYKKTDIVVAKAMGSDDAELSDEAIIPVRSLMEW